MFKKIITLCTIVGLLSIAQPGNSLAQQCSQLPNQKYLSKIFDIEVYRLKKGVNFDDRGLGKVVEEEDQLIIKGTLRDYNNDGIADSVTVETILQKLIGKYIFLNGNSPCLGDILKKYGDKLEKR